MIKFFIYILFVALFVSCGSVQYKSNHVAISGTKAKSIIYQGKRYFLPLILEVDPGFQFDLSVNGRVNKVNTYNCNLNFSKSIIPNFALAVIYPVGTVAAGTMMGVDYWTGHVFSCDQKITFGDYSISKKEKNILILPFPNASISRDLYLRNFAIEHLNKEKLSFLKNDISEKLAKSGISRSFPYNGRDEHLKKLWSLVDKEHFNTVLYYKTKDDKNFEAHLQNVYNGKSERAPKLDFSDTLKSKKKFRDYLLDAITLIPNSFTLTSTSRPSLDLGTKNPATMGAYDINRHPKSLPRALQYFGLKNISNPIFYDMWDYSFGFAPTLSGHSYSINLEQADVDVINVALTFDFAITAFTPFGQFALELGAGPMYADYNLRGKDGTKHVYKAMRMGLNYYAFISNRLFFTMGLSSYEIKDFYISEVDRSIDTISDAYIGFGVSFPELSDLVKKMVLRR